MKVNEQRENKAVSLNFEDEQSLLKKLLTALTAKNMLITSALMLLCIALYFVVVWLPNSVQKPTIITDTKTIMAAEKVKPIDESPWRENQLAKHRRTAQDILSQVLAKQNLLEEKRVNLWGKTEFEQALKNAELGDLSYRNQEFSQAMTQYRAALTQLEAIDLSIAQRFTGILAKGKAALAANNSRLAKEHLQIAMYMQPNDSQASASFDRAIVLDQVLELVKSGVVLIDEQQYELAKAKFEQAFELDNFAEVVQEQLIQVKQLIKARDFSLAMSSGYQKLKSKKYNQAIDFFKQAKIIDSHSSTPAQAIAQSKNEKLHATVNTLITRANAEVAQENWLVAQQHYQQALALDNSLIKAQIGVIKTSARLKLDTQLSDYIDKPERLANQSVYQQALVMHKDALKIPQPGARLQQQMLALQKLLADMKVPVAVTIESDNFTQVTLYRNGNLGRFLAKDINLTPGEYTLVGSRDGFRDVRQEFTLVPNTEHQTIIIQCEEKVTRG